MLEIINEASTYMKKYKCPFCDFKADRKKLVYHIDRKHEELIPEDSSALRLVFNIVNKKDHGTCIVCGKEAPWNEQNGRYDRICSNPACMKEYKAVLDQRMINRFGQRKLTNIPEHQEKMLAGRRISGTYKWSDGTEKTYTGTYEKNALEFLDNILECHSWDVESPGPILEYDYKGERHFYISDIYYIPYNLIIEVKDGGNNPNMREMKEYREKQIAKEKQIIKDRKYNYLRLTNNNFEQLLQIFAELKMAMQDGNDEKIIRIHEHMAAFSNGMLPVEKKQHLYLAPYMMNTVFAGCCLSKGLTGDQLLVVNRETHLLEQQQAAFLADKDYKMYEIDESAEEDIIQEIYEAFKRKEIVHDNFIEKVVSKYTEKGKLLKEELTMKDRCNFITESTIADILKTTICFESAANLNNESTEYSIQEDANGYFVLYKDDHRTASVESVDLLMQYINGYYNSDTIISEDNIMHEKLLFNQKDLYYNKDKFDNGEINLCFITGLSGSGKSTMAKNMNNKAIWIALDDLEDNCHYEDNEIKSKSELIYEFLNGPGKKYRSTLDEIREKFKDEEYEEQMYPDFVKWIISYAKSHKDQKFIVEGVWLFLFIKPSILASYAVYIKGTSALLSSYRAAKRDVNDEDNKFRLSKVKNAAKMMKRSWKDYKNFDKKVQEYRKFFYERIPIPTDTPKDANKEVINEESINESSKKTSLEEINKFFDDLRKYEYIIPNNGKIITKIKLEDYKYYKALTPAEFEKYNGGICWDYAAYQADYFNKHFPDIKYKIYFIASINGKDNPAHSIMIFEYNGKWYWKEASLKKLLVDREYNSENEAIESIVEELKSHNKNIKDVKEIVKSYNPSSCYGLNEHDLYAKIIPGFDKINKEAANRTINESSIDTDLYRFTYKGEGIYEGFKKEVTKNGGWEIWKDFLKSGTSNWLPKPPENTYGSKSSKYTSFESYFTKAGYEKFKSTTLKEMEKHIDKKSISTKEYSTTNLNRKGDPVYKDKYQVVYGILPPEDCKALKEESAYDPPLSYDRLPAHLKNDSIHSWRAKEGIELIHKEPSLEELQRIWKNWNLMSSEQKQASDAKSIELFGKTNKEHYAELLKEYEPLNEFTGGSNPIKKATDKIKAFGKELMEPLPEEKKEGLDSLEFKTPKELSNWMRSNIHYKEYDKLMTAEEVFESKKGSCHDQVVFEDYFFKKMGISHGKKFFIEYNPGQKTGGKTHTFIWYKEGNDYYWFENAWGGEEGLHGPYDSLADLCDEVEEIDLDDSDYSHIQFTTPSNLEPGMSLSEYVDACLKDANIEDLDEAALNEGLLSALKDDFKNAKAEKELLVSLKNKDIKEVIKWVHSNITYNGHTNKIERPEVLLRNPTQRTSEDVAMSYLIKYIAKKCDATGFDDCFILFVFGTNKSNQFNPDFSSAVFVYRIKNDWYYVESNNTKTIHGPYTDENGDTMANIFLKDFCDKYKPNEFMFIKNPMGDSIKYMHSTWVRKIDLIVDLWKDNPKKHESGNLYNEATLNEATIKELSPEDQEILDKINEFSKYLKKNYKYSIVVDGKPDVSLHKSTLWHDYVSLTPQEFEKYGGGICFDFTMYEAYYFKKHFPNVKFKTYYINFLTGKDDLSHTFLMFELGGNCYRFEYGDNARCSSSEKELLDDLMDSWAHSKAYKDKLKDGYDEVRKVYDPLSVTGLHFPEFMKKIDGSKKLWEFYENELDEAAILNEGKDMPDGGWQSTPEEDKVLNPINDFCDELRKWKYGAFVNGKIKSNPSEKDYCQMITQTPAQFEKNKAGTCYDYVIYQADYFKKHFPKIKFKTYYSSFINKDGDFSHTFMYFPFAGKWFRFEAAWKAQAGVSLYDSEQALLKDVPFQSLHSDQYWKYLKDGKYDAICKSYNASNTQGLTLEQFTKKVNPGYERLYQKYGLSGFNESANISESSQLYFLSTQNMDKKVLAPNIPSNYFTRNGFEENTTPRVCFSTSINGACIGLSLCTEGMNLYVHAPIKETEYYTPSTEEVPDANFSKEVWVKEPTRVKCIGQIKITEATESHKFNYGDHEGELWDWDYEWVKRY